ncbi:MAG: outer membrane protein assembly factor BamC [Burkholderiaceae bacterium]|nr:outer membrane protein assembly factor BamC [Burkholderiaceae bacterium]
MRLDTPNRAIALAALLTLAGCSSLDSSLSGDRLDYRSQAQKSAPLEVPPDLTQLARDSRYQPQSGVVSATTLQQQTAGTQVASAGPTVAAPIAIGELRIERQGNHRWLVTNLPPEKLWPVLRSFWQELGFGLAADSLEVGVMETNWAENRAKLPQDFIRSTIGRVFDNLFSTAERDRFRTRVERSPAGTEVFITHRGMVEVYTDTLKESTVWQPRPSDPELEAELLSRLMVRLGAKPEAARTAVATAPDQPARARAIAGTPGAALEVDEAFDRAWRRVGLALDRSGFTVEDRDRAAGLYFVRYVDPRTTGQDEPGFFSKLFGGDKSNSAVLRYRLSVKASGGKTIVGVLNNQGEPDKGEAARQIVERLIDELK